MTNKSFSDEELVAYLDGESEFAPIDEIERMARQDAALQLRLEALRIDRESIKVAFGHVRPSSVELPAPAPAPANDNRKGWAMSAAAAIALVIGLGIGSFTNFDRAPKWVDYVAAYQALYTTDTLASVELGEQELETELVRVSGSIGRELSLAQLQVSDDVEYKRGQLLGFNGKPLLQLAFLSNNAEPLALCIIKNDGNTDAAMQVATLEGMSSVSWSRDGYSYLLIGGRDQKLVTSLAEKFLANGV
ncbi:MAG: hypothetical protein AAFN43_03900 [Pseudomonadota bacterium]